MASQHPRHRPGCDAKLGSDPVLTSTLLAPGEDDLLLDLDRSLPGRSVRARRPVLQTSLALVAEAPDPAVRALPGDALGLRGVGDSPALFIDTFDQQLPAAHVQAGITV
nr:hypothetical protein [Nocardioides sp. LS1]